MRRYFNVMALVAGLLILFLVSEAVYTLNNPDRITYYCFLAASYKNSKGDVGKAVGYLDKCAGWLTDKNVKKYPNDNFYIKPAISLPQDEELKKDISGFIKGLDYNNLNMAGKYDFGRLFYDLAVISDKHKQKELATAFLITAKNVDPTLSFWHVELANYYAANAGGDAADKTLGDCMEFDYPKNHCADYLKYLKDGNAPNNPGFLKPDVDDFYKFKSELN